MDFDAQIWDFSYLENCFFDDVSSIEEIFEKLVYIGDSRMIKKIFVKGK
jgi:hypothetical protein